MTAILAACKRSTRQQNQKSMVVLQTAMNPQPPPDSLPSVSWRRMRYLGVRFYDDWESARCFWHQARPLLARRQKHPHKVGERSAATMQPFCDFSPPPKSSRAISGSNTGNWAEYPLGNTLTFLAESPRRCLAEGTHPIPTRSRYWRGTSLNI